MNVNLIDVMGTDLSVVNAARVSFAKDSKELSEKDEKLIKYLAKHNHWSPFGHASLQFRIKAPIFVARQLVKHQVGLVWNEVSRRYVDDEPEFYIPQEWRLKADNKKQGSSDETIEYSLGSTLEFIKTTYQNMLKANIAPEMARMILPQNLYTEWYWSGSESGRPAAPPVTRVGRASCRLRHHAQARAHAHAHGRGWCWCWC